MTDKSLGWEMDESQGRERDTTDESLSGKDGGSGGPGLGGELLTSTLVGSVVVDCFCGD